MAHRWNLTNTQWSDVLLSSSTPETVAKDLMNGRVLPWSNTLLQLTANSKTVLDLGSGRGDHSAVLALQGKTPTLLDWSKENINFSTKLFDEMNLKGQFYHEDMTKPLPFKSNSFDTVFSCGVFEYFTDEAIRSILREAFRVSSKQVIIMVPNAASVAYRIGKWYMEKTRKWQWGGEVPSYSLKPYFRSVGSMRTFEYSVAAKLSLNFLSEIPGGKTIQKICTKVFLLRDHPFPARLRQGYLLITVGEKEP